MKNNETNVINEFSKYYREHFIGSILVAAKKVNSLDFLMLHTTSLREDADVAFTEENKEEFITYVKDLATGPDLIEEVTTEFSSATDFSSADDNDDNFESSSVDDIFDGMKESGITDLRFFNQHYHFGDGMENPTDTKEDQEDTLIDLLVSDGYTDIVMANTYIVASDTDDKISTRFAVRHLCRKHDEDVDFNTMYFTEDDICKIGDFVQDEMLSTKFNQFYVKKNSKR